MPLRHYAITPLRRCTCKLESAQFQYLTRIHHKYQIISLLKQ